MVIIKIAMTLRIAALPMSIKKKLITVARHANPVKDIGLQTLKHKGQLFTYRMETYQRINRPVHPPMDLKILLISFEDEPDEIHSD
jgi:hypothetical protein